MLKVRTWHFVNRVRSAKVANVRLRRKADLRRSAARMRLSGIFNERTNMTRIYSSLVFRSQCDQRAGVGRFFLRSAVSIQTSQEGLSPKRGTRKSTKLRTFTERCRPGGYKA